MLHLPTVEIRMRACQTINTQGALEGKKLIFFECEKEGSSQETALRVASSESYTICGSWVVFPHPVSPDTTTT